MKNIILTAAEIKEIKVKIRQPINTEQQNLKDARVSLENLTPEQVENTIEQEREGNEINNMNQPVQQEERFEEKEIFVVGNKETIEEIKIEILEQFFKTHNMNIEERESFLELEIKKKNKFNIRIGNIPPDQIMKHIKPKYKTTLH